MGSDNAGIGTEAAKIVLVFVAVVLGGCQAEPSTIVDDEPLEEPQMDYQVVPFEGFGPISADATRGDLVEEFGEDNLEDIETSVGMEPGRNATRVTLDASPALEVVWNREDPAQPEMIRILDERLRTPEGIGLGTTLEELQQLLGEFQVTGFAISVPGRVSLSGSELEEYTGGLELQLEATNTEGDHYRQLAGAQRIPASDPELEAVEPVVSKMAIVVE